MGKWDRVKSGGVMISITPEGTNWGGTHRPGEKQRKEASNRTPTEHEIRAQELLDLEKVQRDRAALIEATKTFLATCVKPWLDGALTDTTPRPPKRLRAAVAAAGGNTRWIAKSAERQKLFHRAVCSQLGRDVPFAQLWTNVSER